MFPVDDNFLTQACDATEPVLVMRGHMQRTVAHALRRASHSREAAPTAGMYTAEDTVWHLAESELGWPPAVGDLIQAADESRWIVTQVYRQTWQSRWRCAARRTRVASDLNTLLTIELASFSKQADGSAQREWMLWRSDVRGAIEWLGAQHMVADARQQYQPQARIYVDQPLPWPRLLRITTAMGEAWDVLGYQQPASLADLPMLEVRLVGW